MSSGTRGNYWARFWSCCPTGCSRIVTSHSPYICQAADPGGLIRLPGPEEPGGPEIVDDALYRRIVYGSGEDAVLSELFGLETPYSNRAEEDRRRLVRLEKKVFSGEASEQEAVESSSKPWMPG